VTLGAIERRATHRAGLGGSRWDNKVKDSIYVYTYWLEPGYYSHNSFLKEGCKVVWCQSTTRLEDNFPFPYIDDKSGSGRLPFAFLEHIPNETSIWSDSMMKHIRDPNLEMDKTASQLLENKDYLCNPMWRRAAQHRIKGQIKNVPGAEIVYHHVPNVPPPEPIPGIPLPAQVENILMYLRDQILDISGQGETSRGRVPSGVRAGIMIEYLQEEDETRLATTAENLEDFVAKLGSLSLERVQQGYEIERLMKYPGASGQLEAFRFKAADLRGNTDVHVTPGSAFPKLKAAKMQHTLDLVQLGIETDPKRVRDLLELGGAAPDEIDLAIAQARRENERMMRQDETLTPVVDQQALQAHMQSNGGMPPDPTQMPTIMTIEPKHWHNDEVHLKEHYNFMSTPEYEKIVLQKPDIDRSLNQHTTMHELNKLMKLQQQYMMLAAAKGAPGEASADMTSGVGAEGQTPGPQGDIRNPGT
jgi:hypothetical protein